jgi:hypothetical protein
MLWNYDQTSSLDMAYHSTERKLFRDGVDLWTQVMSFCKEITNRPQCTSICLGYHRLRQWWPQIQRFPRVRVDIVDSIGSIDSDDRNRTDPQKSIPSPSFTQLIQRYVTQEIFTSYTEGTITSLAELSRSRVMWYWSTRLEYFVSRYNPNYLRNLEADVSFKRSWIFLNIRTYICRIYDEMCSEVEFF